MYAGQLGRSPYAAGSYKRKAPGRRRLRLEPLELRTLLSAAPTLTALSASQDRILLGAPVDFTATVVTNPPGAATPVGAVAFVDLATNSELGQAALSAAGIASLSVSTLASGSHTIIAQYLGSADFLPSASPVTVGASSTIATVAGDGGVGYAGDGGLATAATLNTPLSVLANAAGDLFIADYGNSVVRMVRHTDGVIVAYAGNGAEDYSGDGFPATAAALNKPVGLALDADGNLYIADSGNNRIRRVDHTTGVITTVVGTGAVGDDGDGGPATAAQLSSPEGVHFDRAGNLFIADYHNHRIRRVDAASGLIATVAGTGVAGLSGDGGAALSARLDGPASVVVDVDGSLYIADSGNDCIRKVDPAGVITTIAGTGLPGYSGDGGPATAAKLSYPVSIVLDSAGGLFIADSANNVVRAVNLASGVISTIVGNGVGGFGGDGGPAAAAQVQWPERLALDAAGGLLVTDCLNNRIRRVASGSVAVAVHDPATTLSFSTLPQGPFGGTVTLTAALTSSGSGVPDETVSFRLNGELVGAAITNGSGVAVLGGVSLAGLNPGVYSSAVAAAFAGDELYSSASALANLVVGKATVTVTAGDAAKPYGGADPAFSVAYDGFLPGDDAGDLSGALAFTTDQPAVGRAPVGAYQITPGGLTSTTYDISFVSGTLTISPLALTVTANAAGKFYGEPDPAFTATYVGLAPGEGVGDLGGPLTFSTNQPADGHAPVGAYQIGPGGLTTANYAIVYQSGALTVAPRPLTVAAVAAAKAYGDPDPAFAASYAGFAPGESVADLGGALTFATTEPAAGFAPVGVYQITPSGLTAANYTLHYASGDLSVTPRGLAVAANDAVKAYGAADPTFSVRYAGFASGEGPAQLGGQLAFATTEPLGVPAPAGAYAITPSGLTAANYAIAYADGALTVAPLLLTVTAQDAAKIYGDPDPAFNALFSGFLAGEDAAALSGALTFATDQPAEGYAPVGAYQITPGGLSSSNYVIDFVGGALSVAPRALAVAANDARKTYGAADPTFTVSYAGFAAGEDAARLSGALTFATSEPQVEHAPVGAYPITPSGLTSANYAISFGNGTLTVAPRPLTVAAQSVTRLFGAVNPTFIVSYAGFAPGDDPTTLGGQLTFTTTEPTGAVMPGAYQIIPAGLSAVNYALTFAAGDLTVVPAPQSIGLYDPSTSWFHLRNTNTAGPDDQFFGYGAAGGGWITLLGDWNGDGVTGVALYDPATSYFFLTNAFSTGFAEITFGYGAPGAGWTPLVGDWDGDGRDGVGLYDPHGSVLYLTNALTTGVAEYTFGYGVPEGGWKPLVGDWDNDGASGVGLYDPLSSSFFLMNELRAGIADETFGCGAPGAGWKPLVGDWNADGATGVGLYDPLESSFYLANRFVTGPAEYSFVFGAPNAGWKPIVGDWNGDGGAGVGLYSPTDSTFYLTNSLTTGATEASFHYGQNNGGWKPLWAPLAGHWSTLSTLLVEEQSAVSGQESGVSSLSLIPDSQSLIPLLDAAIARWAAAGAAPQALSAMSQASVQIADLAAGQLGVAAGPIVYLDRDAAGHGWFVDATPSDDREFARLGASDQLSAIDSAAVDRIDLLTVVEHELGHIAGLADLDPAAADLMSGALGVGLRRNAR